MTTPTQTMLQHTNRMTAHMFLDIIETSPNRVILDRFPKRIIKVSYLNRQL
jgi:hypothetical protein